MAESASIMELHAMLVDACKGYDEAIQAAEKPHLKALFEKAKSVHEKAHAEVHAILSARAANPDYEASFLTPVHKVTISTRAAGMCPWAAAARRDLYTHSDDRRPPQAQLRREGERASVGRYNFPLAVRPRADEPPPPANPWASAMLRKEQSA
jgi:hypothetical protein